MYTILIGHKKILTLDKIDYEIGYTIDEKYRIKKAGEVMGEIEEPLEIFKIENLTEKNKQIIHTNLNNLSSKLVDGYAVDFYDKGGGEITEVGKIIRECKYETNGKDFPQRLIDITATHIKKSIKREFDCITFIPPSQSRDKVKKLTCELSKILEIPLIEVMINATEKPQKYKKFYKPNQTVQLLGQGYLDEIKGKSILLIDDVCNSGESLKAAGELLTKYHAKIIVPVAIARTYKTEPKPE